MSPNSPVKALVVIENDKKKRWGFETFCAGEERM